MKFILSLTLLALAAAGCGQSKSSDRPPQTSPVSSQSTQTKASLEAALNSIPGQSPADSANLIATLGTDGSSVNPGDTRAIQEQIGYQEDMLAKEQKALDEAYDHRDTSVHLPASFLDAAAYGISSGFLGWDFARRQGLLKDSEAVGSTAEKTVGTVESETATSGAMATALKEAGPIAFKTTEAVSAAVLGIFFVGKTVQFGKDVVVRFSDTNEIKFHRAKVQAARKNLENAKSNLAAVYSTGA